MTHGLGAPLGDTLWCLLGDYAYRLPAYPPEYFRAGPWNVLKQTPQQSLNGFIRYEMYD